VLCIVGDHAASKQETVPIGRTEQSARSTTGKPFVGQADRIPDCRTEQRSFNGTFTL